MINLHQVSIVLGEIDMVLGEIDVTMVVILVGRGLGRGLGRARVVGRIGVARRHGECRMRSPQMKPGASCHVQCRQAFLA